MKTKTKEQVKKLMEIAGDDEMLFVIHSDKEGNAGIAFHGETADLAAMIATQITKGLSNDSNVDKNYARIVNAIIEGVSAVISIPNFVGLTVAKKLTLALGEATVRAEKGIFSVHEAVADLLNDDNDNVEDDDDEENCATCDANRKCPLPNAVKYRKENGIPDPHRKRRQKKNRNGGDAKGN